MARWAEGIPALDGHREAVVRSLLTLPAAHLLDLRALQWRRRRPHCRRRSAASATGTTGTRGHGATSIGIAAFLAAGKDREARAFLAWLLHATRLSRPRLAALFTLDGRPGPRERGAAAARVRRQPPGAGRQRCVGPAQLDGYGWVLDAAWLLTDSGHRLDGETWRAMRGFADQVAETWHEPDAGIWERRARGEASRPLQAIGLAGAGPSRPDRTAAWWPCRSTGGEVGGGARPSPPTSAPTATTTRQAPTPPPTGPMTSTPPC